MRSFFRSSIWSFLSIASRTASALAINKLVALQFGPNGITLLAHFQNLVTIATTVPNDGINLGLISFLANKEPGTADYRRYFLAGAAWQLLVFVVVLGLFLWQRNFYLGAFLQDMGTLTWVLLFFTGLFLLLVSIYLQALLLARQALPAYTLLMALSSLGSAGLIWFFLAQWPLSQLLLLYLLSQAGTAAVALGIGLYKGWIPKPAGKFADKQALKDIGQFILMALTLVICSKMVNFYVRDLMIRRFDLYQTGLWQAVVKLSDNYTLVFTSLLGMVYYPKLAALVAEPTALHKFVRQVFYLLVPLIALGLLVFFVLQEWFIILLFNAKFLPARYLLPYQVLGDFFKMSAWLLSYIIMVQARTTFYIIVQVAAAVVYLVLLFWLVNRFGLPGVTMAHCASFGLFLLFNLIYFRKVVFKISKF